MHLVIEACFTVVAKPRVAVRGSIKGVQDSLVGNLQRRRHVLRTLEEVNHFAVGYL